MVRPGVPGYADRLTGRPRRVLKAATGITGWHQRKYASEEEMRTRRRPQQYNDEVFPRQGEDKYFHYRSHSSLWRHRHKPPRVSAAATTAVSAAAFGRYGVLSFNGNKMITTSGGGALICPDAAAKQRIMFYATQAREAYPYYQHEHIGYNYRMSNICAGIGRAGE